MLWITLAVLVVALIGFLTQTFDPFGDVFAGLMAFFGIWAMYGVAVLFYAGYCATTGQPFVWIWT